MVFSTWSRLRPRLCIVDFVLVLMEDLFSFLFPFFFSVDGGLVRVGESVKCGCFKDLDGPSLLLCDQVSNVRR